MNSLTVNLHLLLSAFYRPEGARRKILIEAHAFPSDEYAVQSCVSSRGGSDEDILRVAGGTDQLIEAINTTDGLCVVLIGAVQYYSGEWFDASRLARATHEKGAVLGLDCAHAAGNVPLRLHDDAVDFACWCSYKYLNSGPGAIAGVYVHERHGSNPELPRLAGWWGNDPDTRFRMHLEDRFIPVPSADSWQISNPPVLAMAPLRASLDLFDSIGMDPLRRRSLALTGYLRERLEAVPGRRYRITTPADAESHGCQLSIVVDEDAEAAFRTIESMGVVADFRPPATIRVAPTPLYNTFEDCHRFASMMAESFGSES